MGQLVAAIATSHAPSIGTVKDPDAHPQWRTIFAGFRVLRERLAAARPDVLIVVYDDHLDTFFYNAMPAYAIGVAAEFGHADEGYDRPERPPVCGHPALASWLAAEGLLAGFDWTVAHELVVDHGVTIPLAQMRPENDLAVIPIVQNCAAPPLPTARRAWQLGAFLAEAIGRWPGPERIALIGTGGLSHQLGGPKMGWIAEEFDRQFLSWLVDGPRERVARLTNAEIAAQGNGTNEIRNWITVAGAVPTALATLVAYEPLLLTGTGMVVFNLDA